MTETLADRLETALAPRLVAPAFVAQITAALDRYMEAVALPVMLPRRRGAPSPRLLLRWEVLHAIKQHCEVYDLATGSYTPDSIHPYAGRRSAAARVLAAVLMEADLREGRPPQDRYEFANSDWRRWQAEFAADDED